jgi:hypothetical protein
MASNLSDSPVHVHQLEVPRRNHRCRKHNPKLIQPGLDSAHQPTLKPLPHIRKSGRASDRAPYARQSCASPTPRALQPGVDSVDRLVASGRDWLAW